jgi:hypothetical protein
MLSNVDIGTNSGTDFPLENPAFRTPKAPFQKRLFSAPPPLSVKICTDATHKRFTLDFGHRPYH